MTAAAAPPDPNAAYNRGAKFSAEDFFETLADLGAVVAHLADIIGQRAVAQAEQGDRPYLGAPPPAPMPPLPELKPLLSRPEPPKPPRLRRTPLLPKKVDWVTLYLRVAEEFRRLTKIRFADWRLRSPDPSPTELGVDRIRSLLADAARLDPDVHDVDDRLAALAVRIMARDVKALVATKVPDADILPVLARDLGIAWPPRPPEPPEPAGQGPP